MEVWKDVKGFEDYYEISNLGNLKSKDRIIKHYKGGFRKYKAKLKKSRLNHNGYLRCNLKIGGVRYDFTIHRLVAEAFLDNKESRPFINHINGNKADNKVENLEWVTSSENTIHAVKNRLIKTKLTDKQAIEVHNSNLSNRKLASIYGINHTIVWRIKNKIAYKHLWT